MCEIIVIPYLPESNKNQGTSDTKKNPINFISPRIASTPNFAINTHSNNTDALPKESKHLKSWSKKKDKEASNPS